MGNGGTNLAEHEEKKAQAAPEAAEQESKGAEAAPKAAGPEKEAAGADAPREEKGKADAAEAAKPQEPSELDLLREDKKALEERNLRLMAEFDNYRKRTAREKESTYSDAVAETLKGLLPVLDNFQRAMESPCSDEEFKKGMELIYKGLWDAMTALGVEEIAEAGVPFDPNIHNAVMHIEDEKLAKNVVAQVLQKGYRIGGKVLRYAMVQAAN